MKNKYAIIFIILIMIFISTQLYADDPGKKLGRGIANVFTCPLELFKGMSDAGNESGVLAGFTWGIIQGLSKTVFRGLVGLYEIATFPIPIPKDYKPILKDPEFFSESDF